MARLPRLVVANHLHHLIALSHHQQALFVDALDYQKFLNVLAETAKRHAVAVHAFVLLPDRVHLLATPSDALGLSKMMQAIGQAMYRTSTAVISAAAACGAVAFAPP